jgi:hypothetical protein
VNSLRCSTQFSFWRPATKQFTPAKRVRGGRLSGSKGHCLATSASPSDSQAVDTLAGLVPPALSTPAQLSISSAQSVRSAVRRLTNPAFGGRVPRRSSCYKTLTRQASGGPATGNASDGSSNFATPFRQQCRELLKCHFRWQWRNGSYFASKMIMAAFFGLFIGFCEDKKTTMFGSMLISGKISSSIPPRSPAFKRSRYLISSSHKPPHPS